MGVYWYIVGYVTINNKDLSLKYHKMVPQNANPQVGV